MREKTQRTRKKGTEDRQYDKREERMRREMEKKHGLKDKVHLCFILKYYNIKQNKKNIQSHILNKQVMS